MVTATAAGTHSGLLWPRWAWGSTVGTSLYSLGWAPSGFVILRTSPNALRFSFLICGMGQVLACSCEWRRRVASSVLLTLSP